MVMPALARFYPVTSRIFGRLGLAWSLPAAAGAQEVAPEDITPMPPVAFDPAERDLIQRAAPGSTLPQEWPPVWA
ncbi:hypothetical protein [uncultured Boseongicola sp.]|jgi:hypothetical protein|uniref:hypothetical protein n=1 Tax=uncultured Boseongicola sp. TaxID=1648499 RepID=UPI002616306D|nr:hypothetical protein [uncultured Boseongicola sp.]